MRKLLIIMCVVLCGCATFEKQQQKAELFYRTYPNEMAKICANEFPVKTEYLPGKEILTHDTTVLTQTVRVLVPGTKDSVDCPAVKTITKYIKRIDTLVKVNTAAVDSMKHYTAVKELDIAGLKQALKDSQATAKNRLWVSIVLGVVLVAGVAWKLYRLFA